MSTGESWGKPFVKLKQESQGLLASIQCLRRYQICGLQAKYRLVRRPLLRVKCLSLTLPPQLSETKVVTP